MTRGQPSTSLESSPTAADFRMAVQLKVTALSDYAAALERRWNGVWPSGTGRAEIHSLAKERANSLLTAMYATGLWARLDDLGADQIWLEILAVAVIQDVLETDRFQIKMMTKAAKRAGAAFYDG